MNDTLLAAIAGSAIGLAGIIVGFALNRIDRLRERSKQRKDIRRVLRWEIDYNLKRLDDFWRKVTLEPPLQGLPAEIDFEKRLRLSREFLPDWGHMSWKSEAPRLSFALDEHEFGACYELHTALDRFSARCAELKDWFDAEQGHVARGEYWNRQMQQQAQVQVDFGQLEAAQQKMRDFNQLTMQTWNECDQIINTARQRGNPIKGGVPAQGVLKRVIRRIGVLPKPKVRWEKPTSSTVAG